MVWNSVMYSMHNNAVVRTLGYSHGYQALAKWLLCEWLLNPMVCSMVANIAQVTIMFVSGGTRFDSFKVQNLNSYVKRAITVIMAE